MEKDTHFKSTQEFCDYVGTFHETMTAKETLEELATSGLTDYDIARCIKEMTLNETFKFKKESNGKAK